MKKQISIVIDIQCVKQGEKTIYRIYADNDLIVERDWVWPADKMYVRENFIIEVDTNSMHSVRVESVTNDTEFVIRGGVIDGKSVDKFDKFYV
ncbi:MAG: hypothetical protein N2235_03095 [Fischerella sp.]|nr:hypothetical protein [Fischerella sp.]